MKLGIHLGYWSAGPPEHAQEIVRAADDLGFDGIYSPEAYGSDALTPLAWWGAWTKRIRLGTNVIQLSARTPTATAMAAMTLDHLSGGRFILGLGVSGPQVVEGWYGQSYPKPLARTREYIDIVRRTIAREVVTSAGPHYPLPLTDGGTGLGKPLRSTLHPYRTDLPIFLGAEGPKNVALAAEIADGWLPLFFSPRSDDFYRAALADGFARPGARRTATDFEVHASVPVIIADDVAGGGGPHPTQSGAVRRRHGGARAELPPGRLRPDGLGGRLRAGAGSLPGGPQGRSRRRHPDGDGRRRRARRPGGAGA